MSRGRVVASRTEMLGLLESRGENRRQLSCLKAKTWVEESRLIRRVGSTTHTTSTPRSLHQLLLLSFVLLAATPLRRRLLVLVVRLLRLVPPHPRRINELTQALPNGVVQPIAGRSFARPAPEERVATEDGLNVGDVAEMVGVAKLTSTGSAKARDTRRGCRTNLKNLALSSQSYRLVLLPSFNRCGVHQETPEVIQAKHANRHQDGDACRVVEDEYDYL